MQNSLNLKMPPLSLFDITTGLEYATIDTSSSSSHSTFDVAIANSINNASLKKSSLNELILTTSGTDKQRRRRRKVVSFQGTAQVRMIHGMDDYAEEEKAAVWFTPYERQEMKKERRDTVKIMERVNYYVDDEQHYFRGLEFKTRDGFRRKQWNIMESAMVVFDEQMTDARINPTEAISKAYIISSIGSRVAATERAHHDRRAIDVLSSSSSSVSTTATTIATSHVCGEKRIHRRLSPSAA
jgi:hypothetical protein